VTLVLSCSSHPSLLGTVARRLRRAAVVHVVIGRRSPRCHLRYHRAGTANSPDSV